MIEQHKKCTPNPLINAMVVWLGYGYIVVEFDAREMVNLTKNCLADLIEVKDVIEKIRALTSRLGSISLYCLCV